MQGANELHVTCKKERMQSALPKRQEIMSRFMNAKKINEYLTRLKQGESTALDFLYLETAKPLYSFCYSFTRTAQDSEDALSETYLLAVRHIEKFRGKKGVNWLYTIAKNACLSLLRKKTRNVFVDFNDEETTNALGHSFECQLPDESGIIALSKSVLSENEFQIVILHTVNGLKFKEIAAITSGKESTTRWQYNNAVKKVKNAYERREKHEK